MGITDPTGNIIKTYAVCGNRVRSVMSTQNFMSDNKYIQIGTRDGRGDCIPRGRVVWCHGKLDIVSTSYRDCLTTKEIAYLGVGRCGVMET